MKPLVYATDLSEREWKKLRRFLPPAKRGGRPRLHPRRVGSDQLTVAFC